MIRRLLAFRLARLARRLDLAGWASVAVLGGVGLAALLGPLSGYQPGVDVDISRAGLGPGPGHLLGTDHLGRDTFWRMVLASRSFVLPGALACLTALILGAPAGAMAGWRGGWTARGVRYVSTVIGSVPRFVLVLLALAVYGNRPTILGLAAGLAYTPALLEDIHGRIERLRADGYLEGNEAHGVGGWRALWVHLMVGTAGGLIARHMLLVFGFVVVLETTLSYLGDLGVQEPTPSWGNMLVFEWGHSGNWVPRVAPAAALWVTVAAVTTLAARVGEVHRG